MDSRSLVEDFARDVHTSGESSRGSRQARHHGQNKVRIRRAQGGGQVRVMTPYGMVDGWHTPCALKVAPSPKERVTHGHETRTPDEDGTGSVTDCDRKKAKVR